MLDDLMKIFAGIFSVGGSVGDRTPAALEELRRTGATRSLVRKLDGDVPGVSVDWVRGLWLVRPGTLSLDGTTIEVRGVAATPRWPTRDETRAGVTGLRQIVMLDCGKGRVEWAVPVPAREEALRRLLEQPATDAATGT